MSDIFDPSFLRFLDDFCGYQDIDNSFDTTATVFSGLDLIDSLDPLSEFNVPEIFGSQAIKQEQEKMPYQHIDHQPQQSQDQWQQSQYSYFNSPQPPQITVENQTHINPIKSEVITEEKGFIATSVQPLQNSNGQLPFVTVPEVITPPMHQQQMISWQIDHQFLMQMPHLKNQYELLQNPIQQVPVVSEKIKEIPSEPAKPSQSKVEEMDDDSLFMEIIEDESDLIKEETIEPEKENHSKDSNKISAIQMFFSNFDPGEALPKTPAFVPDNIIVSNPLSSNKHEPTDCQICGKTFSKRGYYLQHYSAIHANPQHRCSTCGKRFQTVKRLDTHMRVHAGLVERVGCNYCDRSFVHSIDLYRHLQVHKNVRPYKCGVCNQAFIRRDQAKKHLAKHYKIK